MLGRKESRNTKHGRNALAKKRSLIVSHASAVGMSPSVAAKEAARMTQDEDDGDGDGGRGRKRKRGLDIGSAKVTAEEAGPVRHHLLDVAEIDSKEMFSVAEYCNLAQAAIEVCNAAKCLNLFTCVGRSLGHCFQRTCATCGWRHRIVRFHAAARWRNWIPTLHCRHQGHGHPLGAGGRWRELGEEVGRRERRREMDSALALFFKSVKVEGTGPSVC